MIFPLTPNRSNFPQIKDPLAEELRELAEEALAGMDCGQDPNPEKFMELVYGHEVVELEGFMSEVKDSLRSIMVSGAVETLEAVMASVRPSGH